MSHRTVEHSHGTFALYGQNLLDRNGLSDDLLVIQVDLSNAFNCLDRTQILREVSLHAPHLSAWASLCYGSPSSLYVGDQVIQSCQGVQQGDPLGPLFFALGWQPIVRSLPPCLVNQWYLEDGVIVCSSSAAPSILHSLASAAHQVSMSIN